MLIFSKQKYLNFFIIRISRDIGNRKHQFTVVFSYSITQLAIGPLQQTFVLLTNFCFYCCNWLLLFAKWPTCFFIVVLFAYGFILAFQLPAFSLFYCSFCTNMPRNIYTSMYIKPSICKNACCFRFSIYRISISNQNMILPFHKSFYVLFLLLAFRSCIRYIVVQGYVTRATHTIYGYICISVPIFSAIVCKIVLASIDAILGIFLVSCSLWQDKLHLWA